MTTCIDFDQTITASGVPSDGYTIHVRGTISNGSLCWSNNDQFQVPGAAMVVTKMLNLAYATTTTGC